MTLRYNPPPNWPAPPQGWAPPPGWQPDPAWGPPPQGWPVWVEQKPQGTWFGQHKVLTTLGALVLVFIVIGALSGGGDHSPDTAKAVADTATSPSSTPSDDEPETSAPPTHKEALRAAILDEIGDSNRDGVKRLKVELGHADEVINVTFASNENLTEGLTKDTLRLDTVKVLKAISETADWPYKTVHVTATYSMVDKLGNAEEDVVARADYKRSLIEQINFENFDFKNVFEIVPAFVHPAFRY